MLEIRPIMATVGILLCGLASLMILPATIDFVNSNPDWQAFFVSAAITLFIGGVLALSNHGEAFFSINLRQAFLLTLSSWLVIPLFAALPLVWLHISYTDAFFEAMSAMTTTGSTVLTGLDGLPPGILFWRSILQWIGGIGILVMAVFILPFIRSGGMQLFALESSDNSGKVVSKAHQLTVWILCIYLFMTLVCVILFRWSGMNLFDAINHAMTTVSTGGFSTHDASFGYFKNPSSHWIASLFMTLGALPFSLYIRSLTKNHAALYYDSQVRSFILLLLGVSLVLALWLEQEQGISFITALQMVTFNVVSVVTTTGFASDNYLAWGAPAAGIFLVLTFVGGCTGSTSGAIKIYRFQVLWLIVRSHVFSMMSPHRVQTITYNDRVITEEIQRSVLAFLAVFFTTIFLATIVLGAMGLDPLTAFTASVTAITNVGPGLGPIIGPDGNFASLPDVAKWTLSLVMLIGRLEVFTVLVVIMPSFWW
ncbi:TrkH family potassium uptake protein [Kiloniella laminariae]|uniref:Trk system potassium uptake protein n=1 Tax=Kiloniella laminariae TaxID=454162 RepID=A0ABT4LP32_9PROT|nr:TrkH family potassium uptake protein [Kiloniella laminariae]MCZ4282890.1 TrkH family potassium uptake protein [Kiloniella laminariae]